MSENSPEKHFLVVARYENIWSAAICRNCRYIDAVHDLGVSGNDRIFLLLLDVSHVKRVSNSSFIVTSSTKADSPMLLNTIDWSTRNNITLSIEKSHVHSIAQVIKTDEPHELLMPKHYRLVGE